jgi:hypothetical protein
MPKQRTFPATGAPRQRAATKSVELGSITPDAYYHLEMLLPHKIGRIMYTPVNSYKVKGYVLSQIPEHKIKSAEML